MIIYYSLLACVAVIAIILLVKSDDVLGIIGSCVFAVLGGLFVNYISSVMWEHVPYVYEETEQMLCVLPDTENEYIEINKQVSTEKSDVIYTFHFMVEDENSKQSIGYSCKENEYIFTTDSTQQPKVVYHKEKKRKETLWDKITYMPYRENEYIEFIVPES